jgi:hypothetical protein
MNMMVGGFVLVPNPTSGMVDMTYYNNIDFNENMSTEDRMKNLMEMSC